MKKSINTTENQHDERRMTTRTGGLPIRTDLRAGLAWDDLDDKAQELWSSLTNALSGLTSETDANS